MTNELIVQDDFSRQLVELDKIQDTCKKLLNTKHYQALGEHGIHAIIARAKALGIHPFEALNSGFFVINGKVGMSTEMMAALVRKRGHSITKDPKSNNECVILHGKRADTGDTWTCTFTKEDAERAGLWNGPTWKKYPGVMLYNRCMSMLFRQLFPDLSLGAGYVEDELKEITKTGDYSDLKAAEVEVKSVENPYKRKKKEEPVLIEEVKIAADSIITSEEYDELMDIMDRTNHDFYRKSVEALAKMGHSSLKNIPFSLYERLKRAAINELPKEEEVLDEEYPA